MALTPDDVRRVMFSGPKRGKRGYAEREVDQFLDRVEATLSGDDTLTAEEARSVTFTQLRSGRRGYCERSVDVFLDEVVETLAEREEWAARKAARQEAIFARTRAARTRASQTHTGLTQSGRQQAAHNQPGRQHHGGQGQQRAALAPEEMRNVAFISPTAQQPAYDANQVDAYFARVQAALRGEGTLTAQEMLGRRFDPPLPGRRAYHQAGVDAFLAMVATSLRQLAGTASGLTPPTGFPAQSVPQQDIQHPSAQQQEFLRQPGISAQPGPWTPNRIAHGLNAPSQCPHPQPGVPIHDPPTPVRPEPSQHAPGNAATVQPVSGPHLASRTANPPPALAPDDIRRVGFHSPGLGECGYDDAEVDAFLDRIERSLRGRDNLAAQEVREVRFAELSPGAGGYDEDEVDAFLDLVEDALGHAARRWHA